MTGQRCQKECIIMTEKKTDITESTAVETEKKITKTGRTRKTTAKKTTAEKTASAEKKTTTRRKAAAKAEHPEIYLQLNDRADIQTRDIVAAVKKDWCEKNGKEEKEIKTLQVYLKPFEYAAYYVINGDVDGTGKVDL